LRVALIRNPGPFELESIFSLLLMPTPTILNTCVTNSRGEFSLKAPGSGDLQISPLSFSGEPEVKANPIWAAQLTDSDQSAPKVKWNPTYTLNRFPGDGASLRMSRSARVRP
jgi:hypothetical protein